MRLISRARFLKIITPCFLLLLASQPDNCTYNILPKYDESKPCPTTISGTFSQDYVWTAVFPVIILSNTGEIIKGTVTKTDTAGIYFLSKKQSSKAHPDTVFYHFDAVETVINSQGRCVYGTIPKMYRLTGINLKIELENLSQPETESQFIYARPNKEFRYCIAAGIYRIKHFYWLCDLYGYICTPAYDAKITVNEGSDFYMGEIKFMADEGGIIIQFNNRDLMLKQFTSL